MLQARDFFESATEEWLPSSKPLTLYYCLMNLAKEFCITREIRPTFDKSQHGLFKKLNEQGMELNGNYLCAYPTRSSDDPRLQIFS